MENKEGFLTLLLYYKGEGRNPFLENTVSATYWELEQIWYNMVLGSALESEYLSNFFNDFPNLLDNVSSLIPTSLKAFMYDQYCHVGGSYGAQGGFESWLLNYWIGLKRNSINGQVTGTCHLA